MSTIKKGQEFECIKDYVMSSGYTAFKKGKKYISQLDGCLTNERNSVLHRMTLNDEFYEHFRLIQPMKNTIETPTGCKIAKTEIIDGNLIVTYERDLPESVKDIPNRDWYINPEGEIMQTNDVISSYFSTEERAEAILALGQLLELADYVGAKKFYFDFGFTTPELANDFRKKYSDLFEKCKKLL